MENQGIIVMEKGAFEQLLQQGLTNVIKATQPKFFVEEEILTKKEAADYLKVSESTLGIMMRDGILTPHRPGSHPRFLKSELVEFVRVH